MLRAGDSGVCSEIVVCAVGQWCVQWDSGVCSEIVVRWQTDKGYSSGYWLELGQTLW